MALVGKLGGDSLSYPQDPLLRSGLVLASAGVSSDPSQSLVTALELAGLNLWGTELAVSPRATLAGGRALVVAGRRRSS